MNETHALFMITKCVVCSENDTYFQQLGMCERCWELLVEMVREKLEEK